jgi:hypothetical protein
MEFIIHRGSERPNLIIRRHTSTHGRMNSNHRIEFVDKLCRESTLEEIIFKFSRAEPKKRLSLGDNAYFYNLPPNTVVYDRMENYEIEPNKAPTPVFRDFLEGGNKHVHVIVDAQPRTQLLCNTEGWAMSYSLCKAVQGVDGMQSLILKGMTVSGVLKEGLTNTSCHCRYGWNSLR